MSLFQVNYDSLGKVSSEIKKNATTLTRASAQANSVSKSIMSISSSLRSTAGVISKIAAQLEVESKGATSLANGLTSVAHTYRDTEQSLVNGSGNKSKDPYWQKNYKKKEDNGGWLSIGSIVTKSILHHESKDGSSVVDIGKRKTTWSVGPKYEESKYSDKKAWGDHKRGKKLYENKWARDKDGQLSFADMTKYADKKATIAETKLVEGKAEVTAVEASKSWEHGDVSVKVGNAEAHGSVTAGVYGYDKDGNKIFAPGIEAAVGASVCVITAEANGNIGNDLLGGSVHGEASAGKASAEASASAMIYGKDGKLNPELQAKASAEAIAVEAKGSASVKVLGTEGKVTGSVNVGIGAHADVGYADGKIKCDIGASLGVGASLGFEVDVKGTVNYIGSGAKAVWGMFTGKK